MAQPEIPLPYGTYGMLKSTVERFTDATVPTSLNRHVLSDLSGGDFSALSTTLRFLNLTREDRTVTQTFKDLVAAKKKSDTEYESMLLDVLGKAYDKIIGNISMEEGTLPEVEKAFKDAGVPQGQMLTKAIRFYVKALEDCGVPVSEHITKPRPRTATKNKGTKTPKKQKGGASDDKSKDFDAGETHFTTVQDAIPKGFERLAVPGMKDAFIQYPSKLSKREYDLFNALLTVLGAYVSLDENGEDKKP